MYTTLFNVLQKIDPDVVMAEVMGSTDPGTLNCGYAVLLGLFFVFMAILFAKKTGGGNGY